METALEIATDLIERFEGCRLAVYLDPVGIPTVGWGHVVLPEDRLSLGQTITGPRAAALLDQDLASATKAIRRLVKVSLSPQQEGALISWAFNVGSGAAEDSTLIRQLNGGDPWSVPEQLRRWTKAGGKELPGLVKRRDEEARIFEAGTPLKTQEAQAPRPTLRQGQPHGGFLQELQEALVALRYLHPAECWDDFGRILTASVMMFQANHGLKIDGIVGPQTWQALDKALAAKGGTP